MPGDVAVYQPGARVVRFEGDDDEAVGGEEDDVAAWGVVEFEVQERLVEGSGGLLEEGEVVPVEVDLWRALSINDAVLLEVLWRWEDSLDVRLGLDLLRCWERSWCCRR